MLTKLENHIVSIERQIVSLGHDVVSSPIFGVPYVHGLVLIGHPSYNTGYSDMIVTLTDMCNLFVAHTVVQKVDHYAIVGSL